MPTLMPTFWQTVLFWLKMGLLSFGGPAGQIALMHKELVEDKRGFPKIVFYTRSITA